MRQQMLVTETHCIAAYASLLKISKNAIFSKTKMKLLVLHLYRVENIPINTFCSLNERKLIY